MTLLCPLGVDTPGLLQVMPSLKDQRDEALLKELHRRWTNHNLMVRWLSRFFNYLDRCDLKLLQPLVRAVCPQLSSCSAA